LEEGCQLLELHAPVRIEADEDGCAAALWAQPQIIGAIDAWGRARVTPANREPVRVEADVVIVAIGQGIETRHFEEAGISVKRGNIAALPDGMVSDLPGVFAGGDCVTGPATVIRAIAAGKVAAANIDNYLGFNHLISVDVDIPAADYEDKPHCARVNLSQIPAAQRRTSFAPLECGMTQQEAAQECGRCLRCDHYGYGIFKGGRAAIW
ncbi:MAG TPA: glutamate synthase, partial [Clostridiales bacterium]|nr:glutamate synthase [Clostridiales bacterium]